MPDTQEATTAEVADVLDRAADEVIDRGWCRSMPFDQIGRVCVNGAIGCAAGVELQRPDTMNIGLISAVNANAIYSNMLAGRAVTAMALRRRGFLWNDTEAKDEYEVADELRRAAKDLRNGEVAS